jgi:membrane protease YdiL (CAAX protease family)
VLADVLLFWAGYVVILAVAEPAWAALPRGWRGLAWGSASAVGVLALSLLLLRLERRSPASVGLGLRATTPLRFLAGVLLGLTLFAMTIVATIVLAGPVRFDARPIGGTMLAVRICGYLVIACTEELGFRGYALRSLHPVLGLWPAQAVVALAFGLNHLVYGWSLADVALGVLPGALLFGLAALASRGLALPIGLHAAWNVASWSIGVRGPWTMVVAAGERGRMAVAGRFSATAVLLLAAVGAWLWYRERGHEGGLASPATQRVARVSLTSPGMS